MTSLNDIIPAEYKSRPFLTGTTKPKSARSIDRYSDDPNEGRGNGVHTEPEGDKIATAQGFVKAVWADMNERLGVTPDLFERIIGNADLGIKPNPSLSPVHIDIANKGKILQMITILLTPGNRGIWIEGKIGRGKTFVLESIIRVNNKYVALGCKNVTHINTTAYYDISLDLERSQKLHYIDQCIKGSTFIDDFLYRGQTSVQIYGKTHNVAELIIERMHYLHNRGSKILSTSNFSFSDIAAADVFPASVSRLKGMFHVFQWAGTQDFRER